MFEWPNGTTIRGHLDTLYVLYDPWSLTFPRTTVRFAHWSLGFAARITRSTPAVSYALRPLRVTVRGATPSPPTTSCPALKQRLQEALHRFPGAAVICRCVPLPRHLGVRRENHSTTSRTAHAQRRKGETMEVWNGTTLALNAAPFTDQKPDQSVREASIGNASCDAGNRTSTSVRRLPRWSVTAAQV